MLGLLTADSRSTPPGPEGSDVARKLFDLNRDTFQTFYDLVVEYGDIVRLPFTPRRSMYIVSHPDHIQRVLQDHHTNYQKAVTYDFLRPVVGDGLLTSEGEHWLRQRRLVAPMFHRERIRSFASIVSHATRTMLNEWERRAEHGESIDISAEMARLTLSIAGQVLFNRDIGRESDRIGEALRIMFRDVNYRITSPISIPREVPTAHNRRVQDAIEDLESIVEDLIQRRRGRADDFDDLLSMLMLAEDEETGEKMGDDQIRDEIMTFLIAGHETTSNALAWTFYLLSLHPENRRMLEDEIDLNLGDEVPSFEALSELTYTDMIFNEATRLYPPAWTIEREPIDDDEIGGYRIPSGSIVVAAPYFVHHNPDVWSNPEGFDPERFAPSADGPDHRYAHFPFGGGPRKCVGADFAVMEYKYILAMVTRRFQLDLVPGQSIDQEANVTLHPEGEMRMSIERRHH